MRRTILERCTNDMLTNKKLFKIFFFGYMAHLTGGDEHAYAEHAVTQCSTDPRVRLLILK